ncbi:sulfite exporter TauE/SafE family protein [Methylophilus aquaticus]|uniref:Probable membrane transporter protein n=1 Tax=Methylophilus aquaticus TaxID=1971610 RepID=A0ABT9JT93_9PROT|nr:sulfite exporter TauE/SafE family protein [Methylophilus aquaticus]MDP8567704.1 sulfite exporter TauE/SafE family protein [Methylophilus aquaticus]
MEFGFILAGFAVGFLVGLTGVGGGSLMTPILLLLYNIKPAVAVGTDLLYASVTKSAGIFAHGKLGNIDWRMVKRLAMGSLPASLATLWMLHNMDMQSSSAISTIKFWLGIALIVTSAAVLMRNKLSAYVARGQWIPEQYVPGSTVALGVILGALVTLTSVGAGALGVTALIMLYPKEKITTIVGSDIAHAVPLTMVAGLGHASLGTIDYQLLGTLLIGSIPGIYLGSHLSSRVAEHWVRIVLAIILIYVGFKLVFH